MLLLPPPPVNRGTEIGTREPYRCIFYGFYGFVFLMVLILCMKMLYTASSLLCGVGGIKI